MSPPFHIIHQGKQKQRQCPKTVCLFTRQEQPAFPSPSPPHKMTSLPPTCMVALLEQGQGNSQSFCPTEVCQLERAFVICQCNPTAALPNPALVTGVEQNTTWAATGKVTSTPDRSSPSLNCLCTDTHNIVICKQISYYCTGFTQLGFGSRGLL